MSELTKEDKIKFIEAQGIKYSEFPNSEVNDLYTYALIKDLIHGRTDVECFGYYDEIAVDCKNCWLAQNETCKKLKEYFDLCKAIPYSKDTIRIAVKNNEGVNVTMENINIYLDKLNFKPDSLSYQIAKTILESDNRAFGEVLQKIIDICGPETKVTYAKTRFYQIKRAIQDKAELNVEVLTQKYIHVSKQVKQCPN